MNKQDHIEDNIYLLLGRIRLIRDTLTLDMDPEFFFEKTLDDIDFIDRTMGNILKRLMENQRLIDRKEQLDHFSELEWQFSRVLSDILSGSGSISAAETPELGDRIFIFQRNSQERRETVETMGAAAGDDTREPVLTYNELHELLKDF